MTTTQIDLFLTLAELKSFTETAKRMFISQSSLSKSIMSLEEELNVSLFVRRGNGIQLTSAGKMVQEYFRYTTDEINQMKRDLKYMERGKENYLPIAVSTSFPYAGLFDPMVGFINENKDLKLSITECVSRQFFWLLDAHDVDLAIGWQSYETNTNYTVYNLIRDYWGLMVSTDNPLSKFDEVDLNQAKNMPFIMQENDNRFRDMCRKSGFSPMVQHSIDTIASLLKLVSLNLGVAFLCERMLPKEFKNGSDKVKFLRLKQNFPHDLIIITRDEELSPLCKKFIKHYQSAYLM